MSTTDDSRRDDRLVGGLDPNDPHVQSPAGLGPDNPHAQDPDLGQANMQEQMDSLTEKGYLGTTPDPTPNENYSLQTPPDAPTPEIDADLAAQLDKNVRGDALRIGGLSTEQVRAGAEVPQAPGTRTPEETQTLQGEGGEGTEGEGSEDETS